jgi:predicted pyridoxine 5'-phosphate oxidase superfamily flavin-nucleotide-binding protein
MPHAFANIAFTPAVRAEQARMGSSARLGAFDRMSDRNFRLGEQESAFIAARDSFYEATVSESGWPYVQFRGGPAGFLKVLDAQTLGYARFRGNMQYVSTGNLRTQDRVSLILMDYAKRQRLKIMGRARLVELDEDPALIARLDLPDYRARMDRGLIITVEAFDWNCPQHITPRFTETEIQPLRAELVRLQNEVAQLRAQAAG